jgi:hypothetical protein
MLLVRCVGLCLSGPMESRPGTFSAVSNPLPVGVFRKSRHIVKPEEWQLPNRFPKLSNSPSLLVYCVLAISPPAELPANISGSQRAPGRRSLGTWALQPPADASGICGKQPKSAG